MANDFVMQIYKLPLRSTFKEAIEIAKETAKSLVGGPFLIAFKYLAKIVTSLPYSFIFYYADDI
jgi:hypothetical protein